jgi:drug/metabolite transporter (DMT)-like permease
MSPPYDNPSCPRHNGYAVALICLGVLCIVINDAMGKWLVAHYSPFQIVFIRNLVALPIIIAIVLAIGPDPRALRSRRLWPHLLRGVLLVGGAYTFFLSLTVLPLAEATALIFAAPIFVTILSVPLLGEHVGRRRWLAVLAGFAGVLVIVHPGAAAYQPASLLVVATAVLYALFMIGARWIDRRESVWTMMFYITLCPMLFSGLVTGPVWQTPQMTHMPLFIGMAIFGTLGMTLISQAFRMAPAALVAPFDYTALVWASLFGWLIWSDLPALWTYAGATIIIASNCFIIFHETRTARRDMKPASPRVHQSATRNSSAASISHSASQREAERRTNRR